MTTSTAVTRAGPILEMHPAYLVALVVVGLASLIGTAFGLRSST